ncbi:MAG: dehydrogenase [Blastopirellula sp.]|nr:MAG: dehydrogenase [Blastopirellula sp.]
MAAQKKKLRWGLIGCGDVARKRVAQAIIDDPNSTLVGACRRDETKLNEFCDHFDIEHRFTNAEKFLRLEEIDAVYIATPVEDHFGSALCAMEYGKHALVEKPMAINTEECKTLVEQSDRTCKTLGVAYYRRFYPVYQRIKQLVDEEALGRILSVNVIASAPMDMQPGEEGYWRVDPQQSGGGPMMDVGSHRIDLLIDLLGEPPLKVDAHCSQRSLFYGDDDVDDVETLTLIFPGGIQATLQCLFGTPVDPDVFQIIGTEGYLEATPLNDGRLTIKTAAGVKHESHPPHKNFNSPLIADFVKAVQKGHDPLIDGRSGMKVNHVMEQAYLAAKLNR